ncbi:hypothetical protein CRM22_004925 [Opisthorchis felineus]|uniref:Ig-like domain-containing protein n=1 Tax=Opisthorchis felineus TaxID=147828 RepID=A0A4V3SF59_OPIFE|nr:hypothetical protein CRM22_004925 [Opisthorchis felineus]
MLRLKLLALLTCLFCVVADEYEEDLSVAGYHPDAPPTIILTPGTPGPLDVSEGSDLVSRCSVLENEPFTFKWIRRLPDGSAQILSQNYVLSLYQVTHQDIEYPIYCQATRSADGQIFEELLDIRVASSYSPGITTEYQLTIRSLPAEDLSQGRVMRQCLFESSPELNEQFDFRWLDQNGRVTTNGDSLILLLENLVDLGNYTCEATNRQTGAVYHAKYHVTQPSTSDEEERTYQIGWLDQQYTVNIRPLTAEVIVGKPYEIECEVSPRPDTPVSYRWYHAGRAVGDNAVLRIPSLAYPDIGAYICRAEWTPRQSRTGPIAANTTVEINLALTREMGIEMVPPPGNVMVTLPGETRELHCEFHHLRGSQGVQWFFNEQPLEFHPTLNLSGNVHRIDRMRVSIVILRGVEKSHAGAYECRVNGDIRQTNVIVRDEDVLQINPSSDTVDEGFAVEFHCQTSGSGRPSNRDMLWFYRPFRDGPMIPLDTTSPTGFRRQDDPYALHTSFISKQYARKSDEGEYICRLGPNEAVAKLFVRQISNYDVFITPPIIRVRAYQPIQIECYTQETSGRPSSVVPTHRIDRPIVGFISTPIGENRLQISHPTGLGAEYNGTRVECYTEHPGKPASAIIVIESACPQGYRRCRSGQCIPAGRFCDGQYDCIDQSDEDPLYCKACDPISKPCEEYNGRAPHKKHYMIHWECDGEDDCGNGFDESRCPDKAVARCDGSTFTCDRGSRRIPLAYVCDKERDCVSGEDENNCATPVIQSSPTYRYTTRPGRQVILQCRVTGRPIPRVIWRFNWGCLLDEGGRFRVHSVVENCDSPMPTVVSTLTITGVQNGDDGIYNCEALAGATRAMSADYFVMLE